MICGRNVQEVANAYGVSLLRAKQAIQRVERMLAEEVSDLTPEESRRQAQRIYAQRLEFLMNEATSAFEQSKQPAWRIKQKWVNGELKTTEETAVQNPDGDPQYLKLAMMAARQLAAVTGQTEDEKSARPSKNRRWSRVVEGQIAHE